MYAEPIYFCGTARNCAPFLPRVIENAALIGRLFASFHIIIATADDSPADHELLRSHPLTATGNLITIIVEREPTAPRSVNIARARNATLQTMRQHAVAAAIAATPTHYIMMDCDDVCADPINPRTFITAYNQRRQWDAVTFAPMLYYDLWALAAPPYVFSYSNFANGRAVYEAYITRILDRTPKGGLVQVWSAFCGFGIYKWWMSEGVYDGHYRTDYIPAPILSRNIIAMGGPIRRAPHPALPFGEPGADCEHRAFHLLAVFERGARIRIFNGALFGS